MSLIMYLRTGHAYQIADSVTLDQVNAKLNETQDRFIEVPLAAVAATLPGTPGVGEDVKRLFITPGSVSHFIVI